jgi:DNA-binding response OmpR family regulator
MVNKGRLFLLHWDKEEAEVYASNLRLQGWKVDVESEDGGRAGKAIKLDPPTVVVTSLTRKPTHGLATTEYLAETKSTRHIPLIFVGGEGDGLAKTKAKLPNAKYISDDQLAKTLEEFAQP